MPSLAPCMSLSLAAPFPIDAKAEEHNLTAPQSDYYPESRTTIQSQGARSSGGSVSAGPAVIGARLYGKYATNKRKETSCVHWF